MNFLLLALSIFTGLFLYKVIGMGPSTLSHRNMMSVVILAVLVGTNYWIFSAMGIDDMLPEINIFGSSSSLYGEGDSPVNTDEQEAIMEDYGTVINDTTCIDNYLYKGYSEDNAEGLCKIKMRNE